MPDRRKQANWGRSRESVTVRRRGISRTTVLYRCGSHALGQTRKRSACAADRGSVLRTTTRQRRGAAELRILEFLWLRLAFSKPACGEARASGRSFWVTRDSQANGGPRNLSACGCCRKIVRRMRTYSTEYWRIIKPKVGSCIVVLELCSSDVNGLRWYFSHGGSHCAHCEGPRQRRDKAHRGLGMVEASRQVHQWLTPPEDEVCRGRCFLIGISGLHPPRLPLSSQRKKRAGQNVEHQPPCSSSPTTLRRQPSSPGLSPTPHDPSCFPLPLN